MQKTKKDTQLDQLNDQLQTKKKFELPKKAEFRMRAHVNPLGDTPFPYPLNPDFFDLRKHYPLD